MSDLDSFKVKQEARQRAAAPHRSTPYIEVVNRYLGAFSYTDPYVPVPARLPARPAGVGAITGAVIVGADDAPISHVAVDHAAIEAELRGQTLLIVHTGPPSRDPRMLTNLTERAHVLAPDVAVTTHATIGMGATELLLTDAGATDLIVVGHRHGAIRGTLRRSVADQVAARHPGPVLVVRTPWPTEPEQATWPLLVGMDGSASSTRAAEFAVQEAQLRGCDVILLRITPEPSEVLDWTDRRGGVTVRNRTVAGNPVNELIDAARGAAAVVLGRPSGRSRLGSVNRAVLHHVDCPVFLAG
ncbi:universal stress protein [Actinoplanes sp. NPDC049316]|uniref:universal stress protein n=1 Tax=Actinoplanes sp. NPDC049316 TaxID=3154727 RepID=UPI003442DA34